MGTMRSYRFISVSRRYDLTVVSNMIFLLRQIRRAVSLKRYLLMVMLMRRAAGSQLHTPVDMGFICSVDKGRVYDLSNS